MEKNIAENFVASFNQTTEQVFFLKKQKINKN